MADVFISYAREDAAMAGKLAAALEALNLAVWWDQKLAASHEWDEEIERQLDAAKAVVVIWSQHSVGNDNVLEEAHEARNQNKLVPIKIDDCRPRLFFRRHQYEDFSGWRGGLAEKPFQRLAIQLGAFARGQEAARALPLDGVTAPAPLPAMVAPEAAAPGGLRRVEAALATLGVLGGAACYFADVDPRDYVEPYWAAVFVLMAAAVGLFRTAEGWLPAGAKAMVARFLAGERTFTASEAFLTMFEAVFTKRHFSLACFWRSMTATLLVYAALLLLFIDLNTLWGRAESLDIARSFTLEVKWRDGLKATLEENALLLVLILPLTNIFADYLSLWQTRKVLEWAARGRAPLLVGAVVDFVLTLVVFLVTLPIGPMAVIFCTAGEVEGVAYQAFSAAALDQALAFAPEVLIGFWSIFEGHPAAELSAVLAREASLGVTTLLIAFATTFITSLWLWLALVAAPVFRLLAWRKKAATLLGRLTEAGARPVAAMGYGAALVILGFGGAGWAVGLAAEARAPGVATFRDCAHCPLMAPIPAGAFPPGSDFARVGVRIAKPFAIGVYEVTFREWEACVADGYCTDNPRPDDSGWGRGLRPVIRVSWDEIAKGERSFIAWLNTKAPAGYRYHLPSEAQWAYAARGGATREMDYYSSDVIDAGAANYRADVPSLGRWRGQTLPVGAFAANGFGLHDMRGNVFEWVQDCWNETLDGLDKTGLPIDAGDCSSAVLRGGSWDLNSWFLRSVNRDGSNHVIRDVTIGFRVSRTAVE